MASFLRAVNSLLVEEGGYVVDHAGPTNYGVTLGTLRRQGDLDEDGYQDGDLDRDGDVDGDDIRMMTQDDAIEVYRRQWWDRYEYGRIYANGVATKLLSLSVNMGPGQAHRIIQRALRACSQEKVKEDGIFGQNTLFATNNVYPGILIAAMRSEAAGVYRLILAKHREYGKYARNWFGRAYA